jgi:hypothetical protein
MKKIMALMIGFLLMGFAFAAAQTTEEPTEPTKEGVKVASQVKNAGAVKPMYQQRWRIMWVDSDGDGITDAPKLKGDSTLANKGTMTQIPEPLKASELETTTDPTTVSDISLIPEDTTTVSSEAVTLTKTSFRSGLTTPGMVEGAGTPKGAAAKALLRKGRG